MTGAEVAGVPAGLSFCPGAQMCIAGDSAVIAGRAEGTLTTRFWAGGWESLSEEEMCRSHHGRKGASSGGQESI